MAEPFDPVQSANDSARETARHLLQEARFGTLATLQENGYPFASLVTFALDGGQTPFLLVSRLSDHTKHLLVDPRCSLLAGEPGRGDPLAHPRITLQCSASIIDATSDETLRLRDLFLARHPKAALYIDFPDFLYIRLTVIEASLNGGFGKAFRLDSDDLRPIRPVV
jgi:putative heme iron utilization protein